MNTIQVNYTLEEQVYPSIEEIKKLNTKNDATELFKMLEEDKYTIDSLPARAKYIELYGALREASMEAKDKLDIIKSEIIKAYYDNPKVFLPNTKSKNMQLATAVFKTHPDYRTALKSFYHYTIMVELVNKILSDSTNISVLDTVEKENTEE